MQGVTNKQLHKVNSAMMRNDKVDAQVVIQVVQHQQREVHVGSTSPPTMSAQRL